MSNERLKVAAYCRFSSEKQVDGYSIEAQKKAIIEFCKHNKYDLVNFYVDEAKSGTNDDREAFQTLIKDSSKKQFQAVIVHKLDRFSRDRYNSIFYRKKLKDNGVKLISVLERIDDDNPEDLILLSVLEGMSEYYSKNLSREVKKGMNIAAAKGQWTGGIIPFGYKVNHELKRLEINEDEAYIVREFFHMFANGQSTKNIELYAISKNYLTHKGNLFDTKQITRMLKNEVYIGVKRYNSGKNRKSKSYKREDEILVKNAHDAIIDEETYFKCKTRFEANSKGGRVRNNHEYLLSGFIECGDCGSKYRGSCAYSSSGQVYYYYKCLGKRNANKRCKSKAIPADKFESFIFNVIRDKCFTEEQLDEYANRILDMLIAKEIEMDKKEKTSKSLKTLEKEFESLNIKKQKLLDLYLESAIDRKSFDKKSAELEDKLFKVELEINDYKSQEFDKNNKLSFEVIRMALKLMVDDLISDDAQINKKSIIDALIKKIIITDGQVELYLKLSSLACSDKFQLVNQMVLYTNFSIDNLLFDTLNNINFQLLFINDLQNSQMVL